MFLIKENAQKGCITTCVWFLPVLHALQNLPINDIRINCPGIASSLQHRTVWPDDKHDQVFALYLMTFTLRLRDLRGSKSCQKKFTLSVETMQALGPVDFGMRHLCTPPWWLIGLFPLLAESLSTCSATPHLQNYVFMRIKDLCIELS